MKPCRWLVSSRRFVVGGNGQRSSPTVLSVDEIDKEPDFFKAQLDELLHSDIRVQKNTRRLSQLPQVEQIQ